MIESLAHVQLAQELASLDPGENLAKTAIQAIQDLLEDRNSLREQFAGKQDEIYALRASNEDLRRLVAEIHSYYLGTTAKFVSHLKEIETTLNNAGVRKHTLERDETISSLAQRFSPQLEIGPTPRA